jgi:thioredoxin 1
MVQQLEDHELDEFLKKHETVLVDIFTVWCGPCVTQAEILKKLEEKIDTSELVIVKMDADQCPEASQRFKIRAIPTLLLFKGGELVKTHVGVWDAKEIMKEVSALSG